MQTSYRYDPAITLENGLVDLADSVLDTCIASQAVSFGRFVHRIAGGAADDRPPRCELPAASASVTDSSALGFVVAETTREAPGTYAADDVMRFLRRGRIWMIAEDAVAARGTPVFVRFAAGTFATLGAVRTDADVATAVALPGARFGSVAGIGDLVVVEYYPS